MKRLDVNTLHTTDTTSVEPLLHHAESMTRSRTIGIFATPSTLTSYPYLTIKQRKIPGLIVIEPDCHNWSALIDKNLPEHIDLEASVREMLRWQADVILIVSSSYAVLKNRIAKLAGPSVRVLDATDYI